jgi:hypothetical protein
LNPIVPPWESANPDADTLESFRAIVVDVVERITVASAGKRGGRFDPTRVEVLWREGVQTVVAYRDVMRTLAAQGMALEGVLD